MAVSSQAKLEHQLDAEGAVIGSLLIDPDIAGDLLAVVSPEDFLNRANRLIYQTARALFRSGSPVDAITIRDRIGPNYNGYMVELMEITPTSANWREYAALCRQQARLQRVRDLAQKLGEAVTLLYTDERTTDEVAHLCNEKLQPYWRPKHYYQVTDIPQTGSGKISRAETHVLAERLHKAFR